MNDEILLTEYTDSPEARRRLFDFYKIAYPDAPWLEDSDRFEWQSLTAPMGSPDDTGIWLLERNGRIVGQNIYLRYPLSVNDEVTTGNCSTNLIVLPELVGRGVGHKLIERNETLSGVPYAVGITPASTRAFQKRDWVLHTEARLYSRFIRPRQNFAYLGVAGLKRVVGAGAIAIANGVVSGRWRKRTVPGVTEEEINVFDGAHDAIWRRFLARYAIYFQRRADLLNYKYATRTDVSHTKLLFRQGGDIVGYGVCRISTHPTTGLRLGRLVDYVYDPAGGVALITHIINSLIQRLEPGSLDGVVGVAPTKEIARALVKNGLYLSRTQPAIIKETSFSIEKLRETYDHLWYITLGDSDLDNYW